MNFLLNQNLQLGIGTNQVCHDCLKKLFYQFLSKKKLIWLKIIFAYSGASTKFNYDSRKAYASILDFRKSYDFNQPKLSVTAQSENGNSRDANGKVMLPVAEKSWFQSQVVCLNRPNSAHRKVGYVRHFWLTSTSIN